MKKTTEFNIALPGETAKTLGITEDTFFDTYYEDGFLKVRVLDESEVILVDDDEEDLNGIPEKCQMCEHYCHFCHECELE